jgi:hypothetical protein
LAGIHNCHFKNLGGIKMESREFATIMTAVAEKIQSLEWRIESLLEDNENLEKELIDYKKAELEKC